MSQRPLNSCYCGHTDISMLSEGGVRDGMLGLIWVEGHRKHHASGAMEGSCGRLAHLHTHWVRVATRYTRIFWLASLFVAIGIASFLIIEIYVSADTI